MGGGCVEGPPSLVTEANSLTLVASVKGLGGPTDDLEVVSVRVRVCVSRWVDRWVCLCCCV